MVVGGATANEVADGPVRVTLRFPRASPGRVVRSWGGTLTTEAWPIGVPEVTAACLVSFHAQHHLRCHSRLCGSFCDSAVFGSTAKADCAVMLDLRYRP
jgi:hypothetical protein